MRVLISLSLLVFGLSARAQVQDTAKARYYGMAAWDAYQKHYFKKSIVLSDSALYYGWIQSTCYTLKAEALWFLGNFSAAAEAYRLNVSLRDSMLLLVGAHVHLGMLYAKANMQPQADSAYNCAITIWEGDYVPTRHFEFVEELEYFRALAFLGQKEKGLKLLDVSDFDKLSVKRQYEVKNRRESGLSIFSKSREQLLADSFRQFMLPDDIIPLE